LTITSGQEQDKSINRDDGFYQLSRIYDNLVAQKLSVKRRLDRRSDECFIRSRNVSNNQ